MKLKSLQKKIRRLEKRLREGPARLLKLKQKLAVNEGKVKLVRRARAARPDVKQPARTNKPPLRVLPKAPISVAIGKRKSAPRKVKRKLNLSPERRAELSAAMKARWAAKRAAAQTNSPGGAAD